MNTRLSSRETDTCLWLLEWALVQTRAACWSKDIEKAQALADAFHNLPRLLMGTPETWTLAGFERFLDGLIAKYPEFVGLREELRVRLARSDSSLTRSE
jgi:hypothetical protein